MSRLRQLVRWLGGAVGGLLAVVAAVATVSPDRAAQLFPPVERLTASLGGVESRLLLAGTAVVVGGAAVVLVRTGGAQSTTDPSLDGRQGRPVEAAAVPAATITGDELQRRLDRVHDTDELDGVTEQLRSLAVAVERTATGADGATAHERVTTGAWTDDTLAAAVLGTDVATPVGARLRGWLDGQREARRRIERAVAAIERRLDGEAVADAGGTAANGSDETVANDSDETTAPDGGVTRQSHDETGDAFETPPDRDERQQDTDDSDARGSSARLHTSDDYRTRWRGWLGGTLGLVGLGLLYGSPVVLAGAVVPLAYVGYAAVSALPATVSLRVRRTILGEQFTPGDTVSVRLTVENTGEAVLPDLRVVDGVPEAVGVTGGSPRAAVSLRPGETATLSYAVTAQRGRYEFDDPRVRVRSLAGSSAATLSVPATGATAVETTPPATAVGVTRAAPLRAGEATADSGGEGLEFHSTREYRPGDPRSRVDWRQFAKRRTLVTTQFREERAGRAVVLLDVRPSTRRSVTAATPTGATYAAYAAEAAVERLRADGDDVSLAVLGVDADRVATPVATAGDAVWIADANDERPRTRALLAAASEAAGDRQSVSRETDVSDQPPPQGTATAAATLVARCPADAQVVLVSPFADAVPAAYARRFRVEGYAVTAIAPDHTGGVGGGSHLGGRVAAVGRQLRLRDARPLCRHVIDWPGDRPLGLAVARAVAGGGRR